MQSRDLEKFGAPLASPPAAVVAPAAGPAPSNQSISTNSNSFHVNQDSLESSHRDASNGEEEKKQPIVSDVPILPSAQPQWATDLDQLVSTAKTLHPLVTTPLSMEVHCLILDDGHDSVVCKDSTVKPKLDLALKMARQTELKEQLFAHIRSWLDPLEFVTVYAKETDNMLHINCASHAAMAAAMLRFPLLVRCGCLRSFSSRPCGSDKHRLPELLHLTCQPTHSQPMRAEDMRKLLKETMQLEYSTFWEQNTKLGAVPDPNPRLSIFVLPRTIDVEKLTQLVQQMHLQHEFRGAKVRVQGVNCKQLRRCSQCQQLGHEEATCPIYSGLALRFLANAQPFSYAALLEMKERTQARGAFLGSSVDERAPSRRLTLLFDPESWNSEAKLRLKQVISDTFGNFKESLQCDPKAFNVKLRHKECKQCGNVQRAHACPYAVGFAARPKRPAAAAAVAQPKSSGPPDNMCRSWRNTKRCAKLLSGKCRFTHPVEHVAEFECKAFRLGSCVDERCTFRHAPPAQPAALAEVSVQPPVAPQVASSAPSDPALPAASAALRPVTVSKKRGFVTPPEVPMVNSFQALEDEEEKSSSPASAAQPAAAVPAASPSKKRRQDSTRVVNENGCATGTPPPSSLNSLSSPIAQIARSSSSPAKSRTKGANKQ